MKDLLVICALLTLTGCASVGNEIDQSAVTRIIKGKTTKAELVASLGPPTSASMTADGGQMLMWIYSHARIKGATLVPIVGLFAGGANTEMQTLQVNLDANEVVTSYVANETTMESRMGK